MQITHNLLSQFLNNDYEFNPIAHELTAAIRAASDALNRSNSLKCIRIAAVILLKCIQQSHSIDGIDQEFVNLEFHEVLKSTKDSWSEHADCRLNISRLMYELSKSKLYTKAVHILEIAGVLTGVYKDEDCSLEICENIAITLLSYAVNEGVKPDVLIGTFIFLLSLTRGKVYF